MCVGKVLNTLKAHPIPPHHILTRHTTSEYPNHLHLILSPTPNPTLHTSTQHSPINPIHVFFSTQCACFPPPHFLLKQNNHTSPIPASNPIPQSLFPNKPSTRTHTSQNTTAQSITKTIHYYKREFPSTIITITIPPFSGLPHKPSFPFPSLSLFLLFHALHTPLPPSYPRKRRVFPIANLFLAPLHQH